VIVNATEHLSSLAAIELIDVTKTYEAARKGEEAAPAVRSISVAVGEGEFFSLLGPSGCGKSTTLRMLAGFEHPSRGQILLRGNDVTSVPPAKRDVHMVFQAYALFPHMTIAENVAFGLKVRRVARQEIRERVAEALRSVRLDGFDERRPAQLSGGQQQRVALARALVNKPAALLLDEPLGALDLKLRREMQLELKDIHARTGTTFVYVTHDQEEALTMSDRIAVMHDGVVEQIATPRHIYERPATAFVAGFIGTSNLVELRVDECSGGRSMMSLGEHGRLIVDGTGTRQRGDRIQVTVRPEKISLTPVGAEEECSCVRATVRDTVYLGSIIELLVVLPHGEELSVRSTDLDALDGHEPGDELTLYWRSRHSWVIGSAGGSDVPSPSPA
jgi:spermidine/putrescine transport system ATP-binding protein